MSIPTAPPAGWYDDGTGHQRWWDGTTWGPFAPPAAPSLPPVVAMPAVVSAVTPQTAPTRVPPSTSPAAPRLIDGPQTIATAGRALQVGSESYRELQQQLMNLYQGRVHLLAQVKKARSNYRATWLFNSKAKRREKSDAIEELEASIARSWLELTFRGNLKDSSSWDEAVYHFEAVMQSARVWDVTTQTALNKVKERSVAEHAINRTLIGDRTKHVLDFIRADVACLYLPNMNGPDLYVFPTFIVLFKNYQQFSIHDLGLVSVDLSSTAFQEEERVPPDSEVVGHTWKYANTNGTPDRRFSNNYQVPIARYGWMRLWSESGINDAYMFSNFGAFDAFSYSFARFARANLRTRVTR